MLPPLCSNPSNQPITPTTELQNSSSVEPRLFADEGLLITYYLTSSCQKSISSASFPFWQQVILKARLYPLLLILLSVHDAYFFSSLFVRFFVVCLRCVSNYQRCFESLSFCFSNPKKNQEKSKFHAIVHVIRKGLLALFLVEYSSDLTRNEIFFGISPGGGSCLNALGLGRDHQVHLWSSDPLEYTYEEYHMRELFQTFAVLNNG